MEKSDFLVQLLEMANDLQHEAANMKPSSNATVLMRKAGDFADSCLVGGQLSENLKSILKLQEQMEFARYVTTILDAKSLYSANKLQGVKDSLAYVVEKIAAGIQIGSKKLSSKTWPDIVETPLESHEDSMDRPELLTKLISLKIERGNGAVFASSDECMQWIDNVLPLLKFDQQHYNDFYRHSQYVRITSLSSNALMAHLNPMIGIVSQAITELKNNIKLPIQHETTSPADAEPQETEESNTITKKLTQLLKKYWHDPVWSKVIATVIIAFFVLLASHVDLSDFKITTSQQSISPQLRSQDDLHKLDIQIRHSISELKREIYYAKDLMQLAEALSRIEKSEAMYPEFKDVPLDVLIEQAKDIVKDPQEKIFIGNAYNELQTLRTFQRGYMEQSKKMLRPLNFMDQKKLIQQQIAFSFNVREWNINISLSN